MDIRHLFDCESPPIDVYVYKSVISKFKIF